MLAAVLAGAAFCLALAALKHDHDCQARRLTVVFAEIRALGDRIEAIENGHFKLHLRQDRLQNMVVDRGWRDSMHLTQFDWRKPEPF